MSTLVTEPGRLGPNPDSVYIYSARMAQAGGLTYRHLNSPPVKPDGKAVSIEVKRRLGCGSAEERVLRSNAKYHDNMKTTFTGAGDQVEVMAYRQQRQA